MDYLNVKEYKRVKCVDKITSNLLHQDTLVNKGKIRPFIVFSQVVTKVGDNFREVIDIINTYFQNWNVAKKCRIAFVSFLFIGVLLASTFENVGTTAQTIEQLEAEHKNQIISMYQDYNTYAEGSEIRYDELACHPFLPDYFNYTEVNEDKLKKYLNTRNSLLVEEPYFSAIFQTAREFNLNPLILFAITGQEQSFVPKTEEFAKRIANNPFNVFVSWKHYNTDIKDSSEIAARTVINLAKGRPDGEDYFKWINRLYASDPNWHKGVKQLFNKLQKECGSKTN